MQESQGFNRKLLIIVLAAAIIVLVGGGFWYWQKSREVEVQVPVSVEKTPEEKVEEFGGKILERVQNPLKEKLPETNPFKPQTNPFGTEINPFQETYKNPFE